MAKPKLGRVVDRTYKKDFGKRKNPLPEALLFLSGIPFYAVTKCLLPDSEKKQTRIEILPKRLKNLIKSYEDKIKSEKKKHETQARLQKESKQANKSLKIKNKKIMRRFEQVLSEKMELEKEMAAIKHNYNHLMENIENNTPIEKSNIKTSSQLEKEKGMNHHGVPLQGGSPGQGKKK